MSKKYKSQASSARAASAAFGASSFGFGAPAHFQTSRSLLSYVNEQPDLSGISEPNIVVAFKNLSKKDSTTKEKALDELNNFLAGISATGAPVIEDALIEAWINFYPRTSVDNSRRVRLLAHNFQGSLTSLSGKRIAPRLPRIIGAWLAGTFDQDRAASRAASAALQGSFSSLDKRKALWKLYRKDIIQYVEDAATMQTPQTLSDERTTSPDDAEAKYIRVVGTALSLLSALLMEHGEAAGKGEEELAALIQSTKLWEHAYHPDPFIRRATYSLLTMCLSRRRTDMNWKVISSSFLGKALHASQLGSTGPFSEALLNITRERPQSWTTEYTSKTPASKRLLKFLQQGSQRGPSAFWNNMAHLLELLPGELWQKATTGTIGDEVAKQIIEAYRSGITSPDEPRQNLPVAWNSYMKISSWICEQIAEIEARKTILFDHVFPAIQQYVLQEADAARWNMNFPGAAASCVQVMIDVTSKLGGDVLKDLWQNIADRLLTEVKISQPEQSSTFQKSQDHVAACSRRFFELHAGLLRGLTAQSGGTNAEDILGETTVALVRKNLDVLQSRNGKPYGAASLIANAVETLTLETSPKFSGLLRDLVLEFLNEKLKEILPSPSSEIFISLLLKLRQDEATSESAEKIVSEVLTRNELEPSSPAFQAIILTMTEEDLKHYPQIERNLLSQVDRAIAGDIPLWPAIDTLVRSLPVGSMVKDEILSRMLDGLSLDSDPHNAIEGFQTLFASGKQSVEHMIGSANTSNLLSKLLVLEELSEESVSQPARSLTQKVQENLRKAGSATQSSIGIIHQQLSMTGENALSIHTVVELARDTYVKRSRSEANSFLEILPSEEDWQSAINPYIDICPSRSVAVTSTLQGASLRVEGHRFSPTISHDIDGFSSLVRQTLFAVSLIKSTDVLDAISESRQHALYFYLPLALQIINEKLDISGSNEVWTMETQDVEDEMSRLVSEGRQLLVDLIMKQTTSDILDNIPDSSTVEGCWVQQLQTISDRSPRSYRLAVASADILSISIDKSGPSRYSRIWEDNLSGLRKSPNLFQSAALVVIGKGGLLPNKKLSSELIVDITSTRGDDLAAAGTDMAIILNLLLDGGDDILSGLPIQRLVYLVKAVVAALGSGALNTDESVAEFLKLMSHVLPAVSSIYDDFWAMLWDFVQGTFNRQWATPAAIPLLHSVLKLSAVYKKLAAEETNDDLVEVWQQGQGSSQLAEDFILPLEQFSRNTGDGQAVSSDITEVLHWKHRPRSITIGLLDRIIVGLPVDKMESLAEQYPILAAKDREVQSAAFGVLHRTISDRQEERSVEVALSKQIAHLPDELLSLLLDPPSMDAINGSTSPTELTWSRPRSYLLAWKLIFDHFTKASHKLREMYADDIKTTGNIDSLLTFVNDLLKISTTRPVEVSRIDVDDLDFISMKSEPHPVEAQALAAHLYYLCLLYVPNLARSWWFECKNKIKGPLETWTQKQISPRLCRAAMADVQAWHQSLDATDDDHPLEVKISPNFTELTANIPVDPEAAPVSLMISLPSAYPLQQAIVTSRNRVAVSEKNWQSWLRTIKGIIMFSNGSIIDGLLAFRRNVQGALKGQSECAICYSIIGTDMKTPDKKQPVAQTAACTLNMPSVSPQTVKLKSQLRLIIERLRNAQKKDTALSVAARREMAMLLSQNREASARIRVENIIQTDICVEVMEILELYAELLLARANLLDYRDKEAKTHQKETGISAEDAVQIDPGLEEAAAAMIYAAPRLPRDIRELPMVRSLLVERWGKDFGARVNENRDGIVPEKVVKKLKVEPPGDRLVELYLTEIARTYGVDWPRHTEVEAVDDLRQEVEGEGETGTEPHHDNDNNSGGSGGIAEPTALPSKPLSLSSPLPPSPPTTSTPSGPKSPVSVAPPAPRTDNPVPSLKLPLSNNNKNNTAVVRPVAPAGTGTGQTKTSTGTAKPATAVVPGKIPDVDDLQKRFLALKR